MSLLNAPLNVLGYLSVRQCVSLRFHPQKQRIWTGEESIELGLVDGLASASQVARDIIGVEDIVDYTRREHFLDQFARQIGASLFHSLIEFRFW